MSGGPTFVETYEIHLRRGGKWTIEYMGLAPTRARELADTAFKSSGVNGLRIVRSRESAQTGAVTEDIIIEKHRKLPSAEVVLGAVEDAPYCAEPTDLFQPRARFCLHRLFQGWLRGHEFGVTECLLSPKRMSMLLDRGSLVESAAFRVAQMQVPEDSDSTERRNTLLGFFDGLGELAKTLEADGDAVSDDIRVLADIVDDLGDLQTRLAKVQRLSEMLAVILHQPKMAGRVAIIDRVLSDYLMDDDVVLELAGPRGFRLEQLEWIAATALGGSGDLEPSGHKHAFADTIIEAMAADRLTASRQSLLWTLELLLRGTSPLHDGTNGQEKRAILSLTKHLASGDMFLGGPRLAARLTHRMAEFEVEGGTKGFLEAAETLVIDLGDARLQLRYLMALVSGSTTGRAKGGLFRTIDSCIRELGGLQHLVSSKLPTARLVRDIDRLCVLLESAELGPKSRTLWLGELTQCVVDRLEGKVADDADLRSELQQMMAVNDVVSEATRACLGTRL